MPRPSTVRRRSLAAAGALALASAALGGCASEGVVGSLKGVPAPADGGAAAQPGAEPATATVSNALADTAIAAGGATTCVRANSGQARCWGDNRTGSLGQGDVEPPMSRDPVAPSSLGPITALFAGETAYCALRAASGKVFCWGDMFVGEFAGQTFDHLPITTPYTIDGIVGDVARVAVGRYFTCALTVGGEVRCFGLNDRGQLGLGGTDRQPLPTTVTGLDAPATSVAASMGGLFACAATSAGSVYCWGDNTDGQIGPARGVVDRPRQIAGLTERAVEVVAGGAHACARLESGKVSCWGAGAEGQLGNGASEASDMPTLATYLTDVVALSAGRAHTCAVRREGSVFCWGADDEGQAGSSFDHEKPVVVLQASFGARSVSCGLAHSCAWGDGGRVQCWGADSRSQLGPKTATF